MLPDWNFNGEEAKRRAFIEWVWAELDRLAILTTERLVSGPPQEGWLEAAKAQRTRTRDVGRPPESDLRRTGQGVQAAIWELALLRWMFARYWPGKRRLVADPASAAQIAVARNSRALGKDRRQLQAQHRLERARLLEDEYDRSANSPGRRVAADDIAFLEALPPYFFTR
jgi:hypothetical protein